MKHAITLLAALLLAPLAVLHAAETPPKETARAVVRMPAFSWDTVSTAMPPRKVPPYTDEDYSRIARHSIVAGGEVMEIAGELKKFNPSLTVFGYKNLVLHIETTTDALFRDHPDWFLSSKGKPELNGKGKNKRPLYDLRKPEVREYWLQDVGRMLGDPALDGVFLDAYAKVSFGPVKRATKQDPPADFINAYSTMMDDLCERRANTGKLVIGNYLRATSVDCQIPEVMKYLDGSYLEAFENAKPSPSEPQAYEKYVAKGIAAVQQVAQAGKMIILRLHADDDSGDVDESGDAVGGQNQGKTSRTYYQNLEYKLALFLICAERHSYLSYYTPAPAKTSEELAPDLPEFKKPLGPPKGPAVKDGFTYTRDFQYASVWLDLTKRQGRITWKASYPQAKTLVPGHGDDHVKAGAVPCTIVFDRPIAKGAGAISLYRMKDRKKLASVAVESDAVSHGDDTTAVIQFPTVLEANTSYSITVDKGAFLDNDKMNFLGTPVLGEWSFTTGPQR
jgi:hypothetical protein